MCVRIDSYESETAQDYVRNFLDGRFANSAFCFLAPDGEKRLTASGRGPEQVFQRMGYPDDSATIVTRMQFLADAYPTRADSQPPLLPDFDSFRQALNVASADQRVLVVLQAEGSELESGREKLRTIAWSDAIVGRFHYDSAPEAGWHESIEGLEDAPGIHLVLPGEFGCDGRLHSSLPLSVDPQALRGALLGANRDFAASTERKVYARHVARGRKLGIYFEGNVPYGEDRDADGKIDGFYRHDPGVNRDAGR